MNLDESVSVVCSILKGDTPLKIWWTFNEDVNSPHQNLTSNDGVVISRNSQKLSVLAIEAIKARHRGNYTCHASNKGGTTQTNAYLAIHGSNIFTKYKI